MRGRVEADTRNYDYDSSPELSLYLNIIMCTVIYGNWSMFTISYSIVPNPANSAYGKVLAFPTPRLTVEQKK
jgi:hypothetical protein